MAGVKAEWPVTLKGAGFGMGAYEETRVYGVNVDMALNRDPARRIVLHMTPDAAEALAHRLIESAQKAREHNTRKHDVTRVWTRDEITSVFGDTLDY